MKLLALCIAIILPLVGVAGDSATLHATNLASLIAPDKLATLRERGANQRVQKAAAVLEQARRDGYQVSTVASNAVFIAGYTNSTLAQLTRDMLTRNHGYADRLGVFNPVGLQDMKRGQSPTIPRGTYKGQELSVDHIIPLAVAYELDNVIANLELMPLKMNEKKGDKIGERQRVMAKEFRTAGLITQARLNEILRR